MNKAVDEKKVLIEALYLDDCPNSPPTISLLENVKRRLNLNISVKRLKIDNEAHGCKEHFLGSPSIRLNGKDIEGRVNKEISMACRIFENGTGVPEEWMIEAAILRALQPKHILFLCVANSARSQMAEGIARSLAPNSVKITSAGSNPSRVNPLSIEVLKEIGIDISNHKSKSVETIEASNVDAVITLCGEEVCPVFLGKAIRLHWGLPDPAHNEKVEFHQIDNFRKTRDELKVRLDFLFRDWHE